jgi:putative copper export protein/mono/diheme cytochrome c family protein
MFVPPIDLQGGLPLAAARAAMVMALLSVFGALVFRVRVAPRALPLMLDTSLAAYLRWHATVIRVCLGAAILCAFLWAAVQTAAMADAETIGQTLTALPDVLTRTLFGHVMMLQLSALFALAMLLRGRNPDRRAGLQCFVAGVAVALQAGHSHAESMYQRPSLLLLADIIHLLAAGAWLGGLLPLLGLIRVASPQAGAVAARWFSPLGQLCVAALALTALFQGYVLVASVAGLVGTAYGWMVLVKIALFVALLGFAYANRYRFAPRLRTDGAAAKPALVRSIAWQSVAAFAILAAAAILSELPPSMHGQPLWPFANRISFAAVNEDPAFFWEVARAAGLLGAALLLLAAALLFRRARIACACIAAIAGFFAVPHFDLLLVPAYPTSFFTSPTGFSAESIAAGAALYPKHCAVCHGATGAGDGPLAKTLPVTPANLTAPHLWMHSDGELFWWLTNGIKTPEGKQAMPGFARVLEEDQRWALIDDIRANNAGRGFAAMGNWDPPTKAPAFEVRCTGKTLQMSDLRGRFVRLIIGAPSGPPARLPGLVTIATQAGKTPPAGLCLADDESIVPAYAVIAGLGAQDLAGWQFLIDPDGWLRAAQRAGGKTGWDDGDTLQAELGALRTHKVDTKSAAGEKMNMPM